MISKILSQSKAAILIVKDFQVQLMLWEKQSLSLVDIYSDFQDSRDRFDEFLDEYSGYPWIILNDVIEESFRNETVVHVSPTDRGALLDRKLSYSFRNTQYRVARITGREEFGRRDDTVMLSALTKPELLNPWVEKVLSEKVSVQCVGSVAYLTESFLGKASAKSPEHLMMISLEGDLNLRQTYLRNGKVLFSRLTTLASPDVSSLGESIYQESLQIRQYLERIKLLSYESHLEIRVYVPRKKSELASNLPVSGLNSFECYDTREEGLNYNLDLKNQETTGLYLLLANVLQKKRIENIYANFDVRRYFHLKVISQALVYAASAIVVIAMALNVSTVSEILDKRSLRDLVQSQSTPLREEYERLTQRFPETPIDSKEMALMVETYETIRQQSHMPAEAMNIISRALSESPELQIFQIDWSMVLAETEQNANQGFFGYTPPQEVAPESEFTQGVLDGRASVKVVIEGIAKSPDSYREAQDQVLAFVDSLEAFPGVSVEPVKMPTDVRVDAQVFTTVGDDELRAAYTLELSMEGVFSTEGVL